MPPAAASRSRPSITPDDDTMLEPGAVITLEPGMEFARAKQMVHEEDIEITETKKQRMNNHTL